MRSLSAVVLLACAGLVGATPADPSPFPQPAPVPPPVPTPAPVGSVINLTTDGLYVVSYKGEGVLRVHPAGLVSVTKEVGPLKLRGKFADGTGATETRSYAGPSVWVVEAVPGKSGRIELDLIPVGATKDADIFTAAVDVNGGAAPQPVPQPQPAPAPPIKPEPAPVPAPGAWVIVVQDETVAVPASLSGPTLAKLRADGRGHVYGTNKDAAVIRSKKYDALLAEAGVTGSGLIVLDRLGAKVLVVALPATDAELAAKIKGLVTGF